MGNRAPIDFAKLNDALLDRVESLLLRWLPNGTERNGRWYVGDFDGGRGESANVNMATGQWIDNAAPDTEKGGDLISLYARINGLSNFDAAKALMEELGWTDSQTSAPWGQSSPPPSSSPAPAPAPAMDEAPEPEAEEAPALTKREKREPKWKPIVPVPKHAPAPTFRFGFKDKKRNEWVELDAVRTWAYEFEGQLYGHVARFERISSDGELVKDTVPLTWCENTEDGRGGQRWHWKAWEQPRPLYVPATLLSGDPSSVPVVIVEGEKCAQAGHELLGHEFDFVSWPGGCKTWHLAAWSWLMGRTVYLWPDCDAKRAPQTADERKAGADPMLKPLLPELKQPGMRAMVGIGSLLLADYGCTVHMCSIPAPGDVADGWDIADAIAEGWDAERVRAFIRRAHAFVAPDDAARAKAASTPSKAGAAPGSDAQADDGPDLRWRKRLITSQKGAILAVRDNLVLALDGVPSDGIPGIEEAKGVIAFNEFTNDVIKLKATPWGTAAGVWDEEDELEMGNWLTREYWLPSMPRGTLEEAVLMVAKRHRYHPVRERLMGLRGKWDQTKRLATWLRRACMSEDETDEALEQYLARVGTWLLMAMCARVMPERKLGTQVVCGPGTKFDYMVIFEGGQGLGKSTLAAVLGGDYFADTGLMLGEKDSYQQLQGVHVYEMGELDAMSKSDITKIKLFISSTKDRFRASFDRRAKNYPRQVIFVGTTNEDHYLTDPTGNRRFWPVKVTRRVDIPWVRDNLDQMLAEALHYLDQGERFHPTPREQLQLFDPQQTQRVVDNAIASKIASYLHPVGNPTGLNSDGSVIDKITLVDLLGKIGIGLEKLGPGRFHEKQAAAALRALGWYEGARPTAAAGSTFRPRYWCRPSAAAAFQSNSPTQGTNPEGSDAPPF